MGYDIGIRPFMQPRLVAYWAFFDLYNVFLATVVEVISIKIFSFFSGAAKVIDILRIHP